MIPVLVFISGRSSENGC